MLQTLVETWRYCIWYFWAPVAFSVLAMQTPVLRHLGADYVAIISGGMMQLIWNVYLSTGKPVTVELALATHASRSQTLATILGPLAFGRLWGALDQFHPWIAAPQVPARDFIKTAKDTEQLYGMAAIEFIASTLHFWGLLLVVFGHARRAELFRCFTTPAFAKAASHTLQFRPSITVTVALVAMGRYLACTESLLLLALTDLGASFLVRGFLVERPALPKNDKLGEASVQGSTSESKARRRTKAE